MSVVWHGDVAPEGSQVRGRPADRRGPLRDQLPRVPSCRLRQDHPRGSQDHPGGRCRRHRRPGAVRVARASLRTSAPMGRGPGHACGPRCDAIPPGGAREPALRRDAQNGRCAGGCAHPHPVVPAGVPVSQEKQKGPLRAFFVVASGFCCGVRAAPGRGMNVPRVASEPKPACLSGHKHDTPGFWQRQDGQRPTARRSRARCCLVQDLSVTFSFTSAALRRAVVRTVSPATFVALLATPAAERAASAALLCTFLTSRVEPSPEAPAATAEEATLAAAPMAFSASPALTLTSLTSLERRISSFVALAIFVALSAAF